MEEEETEQGETVMVTMHKGWVTIPPVLVEELEVYVAVAVIWVVD